MSDKAEIVVFWIFAIPLILSAAGVLVSRNAIHAAMSLVAAFFFLAGIYILLTAHLIAFLQILVYAGAVMVLFLFVIMLLSLSDEPRVRGFWTQAKAMQVVGVAGAIGVVGVVLRAVYRLGPQAMKPVGADFGTVRAVARVLFTDYLLPFEATSLLLLVAIVGAVVVAKARI